MPRTHAAHSWATASMCHPAWSHSWSCQLCPQVVAIPPAAYVGLELHLRSQAAGTVWQPDLLASFPGLLTWEQLEPQARSCFGGLSVDLPPLASPPGLDAALARLQIYWVDTQLRGLESTNQGPQWRQQKQIADSKRALGQQAGGPNSKNAALPLIPLGLGKQAHICLATCLPSPFDTSACLDDDASFACRGMCVLGPCIRTWRQLQLRALRKLVRFLSSWEARLRHAMHPDVRAIAHARCPAALTVLAMLQRWPDVTLGRRFIEGFRLVGSIESPGIFRDINPEPPSRLGLPALMGEHAARVVAKLERTLPNFPLRLRLSH